MGNNSANHSYFTQILAALSVSYLIGAGGLMVGYTSSAIISLKETPADDSILNSLSRGFGFGNQQPNPTPKTAAVAATNLSFDLESKSAFKEFNELTDEQASWIGSLVSLGCAGCFINPFLSQMYGSRGTLIKISLPLCILGWVLIAIADNLWYIYAGRFLGGLSFGTSCAIGPVYISQICCDKLRGPLAAMPMTFITIGILVGYIMGTFFTWRFIAIIFGILILPNIIMLLFTPAEPQQQEQHTDKQKKNSSTSQVANNNIEKDAQTRGTQEEQEEEEVNWSTLASVKCIGCVFALMAFQQLIGSNAVQAYAVLIFQAVFDSSNNNNNNNSGGESETGGGGSSQFLDANYCSIIIATIFIFSASSACILIQKLGRKILINISLFVMALAHFALGIYFYIQASNLDLSSSSALGIFLQWLPLISLVIFIASYGAGMGSVCYPLCVEMLPNKLKTKIFPLASSFNWICTFFVMKTYSSLVNVLNTYGIFWAYGIISIVGLIFVMLFVPETKDKDEKFVMEFYSSGGNNSKEIKEQQQRAGSDSTVKYEP